MNIQEKFNTKKYSIDSGLLVLAVVLKECSLLDCSKHIRPN